MTKKRVHNISCTCGNSDNPFRPDPTYVQKYPVNVGDVINFTFEGFTDNTPITVLVKGLDNKAYDWGNTACEKCPLSDTYETKTAMGYSRCRAIRSLKKRWNTRTICRKGASWKRAFAFVNPADLLEDL